MDQWSLSAALWGLCNRPIVMDNNNRPSVLSDHLCFTKGVACPHKIGDYVQQLCGLYSSLHTVFVSWNQAHCLWSRDWNKYYYAKGELQNNLTFQWGTWFFVLFFLNSLTSVRIFTRMVFDNQWCSLLAI